jgi:hypothetical protein
MIPVILTLTWQPRFHIFIPAEAGIQWLSGCRIKSGMTVRFRVD